MEDDGLSHSTTDERRLIITNLVSVNALAILRLTEVASTAVSEEVSQNGVLGRPAQRGTLVVRFYRHVQIALWKFALRCIRRRNDT